VSDSIPMYYRIFSKVYQRAAKKMCLECQDFIEKGSRILDLGCGPGIVGKNFKDFFQAKVIGVDIKDKRIANIPFKIIDGKSLPFKENEFDICLISYVLHHLENPERILKEAKRVSKGKIIIFEDLPENFLSKLICQLHGFTFNKFFQKPSEAKPSEDEGKLRRRQTSSTTRALAKGEDEAVASSTRNTQFSFKSEKEWEKIFQGIGLNTIFKKRIHNFPIKKELFVCRA